MKTLIQLQFLYKLRNKSVADTFTYSLRQKPKCVNILVSKSLLVLLKKRHLMSLLQHTQNVVLLSGFIISITSAIALRLEMYLM